MTEFMMVSNLRIQATMTTFPGFPVALRREAKALMSGLQRMAVMVAMYKTARTSARPPQMKRLPRNVPLSRANGASPTSAAICRRSNAPSSGHLASSVVDARPYPPAVLREGGISTAAILDAVLDRLG